MIQSYAYVNNLFYEQNKQLQLPHNIWFSRIFQFRDSRWCLAGVNMLVDVLLTYGRIDLDVMFAHVGHTPNLYLHCCTIQGTMMKYHPLALLGTHVPNDLLLTQMKKILQLHSGVMLSLTRWEASLSVIPMSGRETKKVFQRMLGKITKLWEINYKILSKILATPVVVSATRKLPALVVCLVWCQGFLVPHFTRMSCHN